MSDPEVAILAPGAVFHERYEIVRCLKAGGMGAVYEVLDRTTAAPRALKVMQPELLSDDDMRARFAQEARVTGGVESEHVVRTSDAGVDARTGTPFLVMDLLRGEELGRMLKRRGRLPADEVVAYLFQAAMALDRTHAASIVHRDLKPENLFITRRDDGSPCLKILDFGIAKVLARSLAGPTTRSIGTPLYMAPEQLEGRHSIGPRADLYALAQIAFALLVGEPYWARDLDECGALIPFFARVIRGVEEPASARAESRGVTLSPAFDAWFLKATAVRAADRFDRATAAITALAAALRIDLPKAWSPAEAPIEAAGAAADGGDTEKLSGPTGDGATSARRTGPTSVVVTGSAAAPARATLTWPIVVGLAAGLVVVALIAARPTASPPTAPAPAAPSARALDSAPLPTTLEATSTVRVPVSAAPAVASAPVMATAKVPPQPRVRPAALAPPASAAPSPPPATAAPPEREGFF
ncbi:MAG: serine/threonine-protein kinase [Byssovorax sp.]